MIGVGPAYFTTVGRRLRIGRDFAPRDVGTDPNRIAVAIVNDAFVRQYLGPGHPIGQHFGWGDPPKVTYDIEVVGVVNDAIHDDVRAVARPLIYFPSEAGGLYVVRAADGTRGTFMGSLRRAIHAVDPGLIVAVVAPK